MSYTIKCLSNFIFLENLFCINRCFLIECPRKRTIGNIIFFFSSTLLIMAGVNCVLNSSIDVGHGLFQTFLAVHFIQLVISARVRRFSFDALKRLDDKCGVDVNDVSLLSSRASKLTFITLASAIAEVLLLKSLELENIEVFISSVMFSAQDAELIFFSMIIDIINVRLSKLKDSPPAFGSKVYRHILLTIELINEEFTPKLHILFATVLVSNVIYSSVIMLSLVDAATIPCLLWRELKAFFCVWRVCNASWECERICKQLTFHLAETLTLDPSVDKGKNPHQYEIISRWYLAVLKQRPRIISGPLFSLNLSIPLRLMDISVNYVLIIVQIYMAYH